jgi:hypothetical protein
MNCLNRANVCASSTIGANFRIDFINIAFRDSFNRALVDAGSTSSAIIIDFVSHDLLNLGSGEPERVNTVNFRAKINIFN